MSRIHRIAVGEGSPEGTNSAYVLPDRGVVVDPGPPTDVARSNLWSGIGAAGIEIDDIEVVVVTHWHADHAGLAPDLADAANADLYMGAADAPLVSEYASARERRIDRDGRRLATWGVPQSTVERILDGDSPSPMPDTYPVRTLEDGDTVAGLEVVATPGHTAGHVSFLDADSGALFLGDVVLQRYTPNVGGGDTRVERPLATYLDSLDRLVELARQVNGVTKRVDEVSKQVDGVSRQADEVTKRVEEGGDLSAYPGHGMELSLRARIDEIRDHHADRTDRVLESVRTRGSSDSEASEDGDAATPWDVAVDLFGDMQGIHAKMGAGEAASHLTELAASGHVDRVNDSPVAYE